MSGAHPLVELPRRRFTVAEFEHMGHTGILGEDDRVELLDGEIVVMAPIGPSHAGVVDRLHHLLTIRLGDRATVRGQNPLRLAPHSEPQPDLVVARPRADFYATAHPGPNDALLVIEVSETSLPVDRGVKVPLYAAAGVGEVWVVDIEAAEMHVYRSPHGPTYDDTRTVRRGDQVSPESFSDLVLDVSDILGL